MSNPSRPSAAVYRRRRLVVGTLALLVSGMLVWGGGFSIVTLTRPLPAAALSPTVATNFTGAPADLALPTDGRMALAADGFDGLIAHSGDQGEAPIASITKVVTALVVLEAKPIEGDAEGPTITFTDVDVQIRNDVLAQNGSNAPVSAGLELSERDALTVMLLPSANNYAISLANWAFGSTEAFVSAATEWLRAHGLTQTRITEPTGLSSLNVSTPSDLVQLARLAEADPVVADIVDEPSATITGVGLIENTNTLLGQAGIVGIKTGTTDEAGSCLLFAARITVGDRPVLLVGVLLGGSSHDAVDDDVRALVETATSAFRLVTVANAGDTVATATTAWGETSSVVAESSLSVVAFGDIPVTASTQIAQFRAEPAGAAVGTLTASSGSQHAQSALLLTEPLADPGPWWRLAHAEVLG